MITLLLMIAAGAGCWKAGRAYQKWRSGPGWKPQLRD